MAAVAFGALERKVTVLSALTSGDLTGGGPNCDKADISSANYRAIEIPKALVRS